MAYYISDHSW